MLTRRQAMVAGGLLALPTGAHAADATMARPLSERGLENLVAFARLYGAVRYFHPSDQAAAANWQIAAIAGVERVEGVADAEALAGGLQAIFAPMAPTLAILPAGAKAKVAAPPSGEGGEWIAWLHEGIGLSQGSVYKSERRAVAGVAPGETVRLELGGGLSAILPVSLYRGADDRTLPTASEAQRPSGKPANFRPTGDDRATRLADVVIAWNILQHFYPYFDEVKVDWNTELRTALSAAATQPDARAFKLTLQRLIEPLDDGHGGVNLLSEARGMLPMRLDWIENAAVVTGVREGSTLATGDIVLAINGRKIDSLLDEQRALISGSPQHKSYAALSTALMNALDRSAVVTVRHADGTTADLTIAYEPIVQGWTPVREVRPEPIAELKPGVFYVDLDLATDDTLKAAMPRLTEANAVVFDIRGYPRNVSFWFLSTLTDKPMLIGNWHTQVTSRPNHDRVEWKAVGYELPKAAATFKGKLVFIAGPGTISKAEVFLELVAHYKLGDIVGATTVGANGNINPFVLPGGYRINWTGLRVRKHDGSTHHAVGIPPTVPMTRTIAGVRAGRDELLEKAISLATA